MLSYLHFAKYFVLLLTLSVNHQANALSPHDAPSVSHVLNVLSYYESSTTASSEPLAESNIIQCAIGFSLAPYVLQNSKGLLGEIITQALKEKGYQAKFHFMSNSEALSHFENGGMDAVAVVKEGMSSGYISNPVVTFNNVAISLTKNHFKITKLEDLTSHSLAGFSNAKQYLGQDFFSMSQKNNRYIEIANQKDQIKALFDGKVDFVVADETIFRFNQNILIHEFTFEGKYREKVNVYRLFKPIPYYVAFSKKSQVAIFNEGLDAVIKNGKVTKIYQKYTELLHQY